MARFFVPQKNIQSDRAWVDGQELRHLRRVLRLAPGDGITIFDDAGREYEGVIRSLDTERAAVEITRSFQTQRESMLELVLALGLTKGDKMDLVVEKATELGVSRIIPFASVHAVPKLDATRAATRAARWRKIALSAVKQCGRAHVPEISPPTEFDHFVEQSPMDALKLLFWEKETAMSLRDIQAARPVAHSVITAIGPEGGFGAAEAALATSHGFHAVSLGRRILRVETAAVTALSLVQYLWGDLG